jgi:predicted O-methyltransferase YrrM
MNSFLRSFLPYGLTSKKYHFNFKKLLKNILPTGIVESVIIKNAHKKYTVDYLKSNYVSDLTNSEKWTLLAFLLMLEKSKQNVDYLEVGIYAGGTIKFLQENSAGTHFTGVDLFEDFVPSDNNTHIWQNYTRDQVLESLDKSRVLLEKGDSVLMLKKLRESGKKFDFIFIDGNHTYQATKDDLEEALPLLKDKGYLAFHNCSPGLTQEDRYYLKLDGGPWLLTQELMENNRFILMQESDRIKVFQVSGNTFYKK